MLVADMQRDVPHPIVARTVGTRIGESLDETGSLSEDAMARTVAVLREYAKGARERRSPMVVVATSALRRAQNASAFAQSVQDAVGAPLRVLTGEEEAHASYRGAVGALPPFSGTSGVVDIGGGSTEYALGDGHEAHTVASYEIGAVRLTEKLPSLSGRHGNVDGDSLTHAVRLAAEALAPMHAQPPVDRLLLVGGSATTTASVAGLAGRAPEVTRPILAATLERLCGLDLEQRKAIPGMRPQRADILPAGIILLATAMELVGHRSAIVAPGDLLLGVLLEARDRGTAALEPK